MYLKKKFLIDIIIKNKQGKIRLCGTKLIKNQYALYNFDHNF